MTGLLQWLLGLLRAEHLAGRTQALQVTAWSAEEFLDDRIVRVVRLHNGSLQAVIDPLLSFYDNDRERGREYVLANFHPVDDPVLLAYAVLPGETVRAVVEEYRVIPGTAEIYFEDAQKVRWWRNLDSGALRRETPTAVERAVDAVRERLGFSRGRTREIG